MKAWAYAIAGFAVVPLGASENAFDRVEQALTWSAAEGELRGRLSGTLDGEAFALPQPAPGVIDAEGNGLFNPRLSVFLDAQLGRRVYVFAQGRADRGFDPANERLTARLDEWAVRIALADRGRLNVQLGKFATIVGNWAPRHGSWSNPFITAPVAYEQLTGVWDNEPPHSVNQLLQWSHVRPGMSAAATAEEKYLRVPIIWGPSYTTGIALSGASGKFRYAAELKNAALSSRPAAWGPAEVEWDHLTVSARASYVPDARWEFGWSASEGSFLRPKAEPLLAPGRDRGDYRQIVLGQDVSFAWHHLQLWAEVFAARFELPPLGHADLWTYYVEAKYKFTPVFSGAVRWNQQRYGTLPERGIRQPWGRDLWRIDLAPTWRLSAHAQVKIQYSFQRGDTDDNRPTHLLALQNTVRF